MKVLSVGWSLYAERVGHRFLKLFKLSQGVEFQRTPLTRQTKDQLTCLTLSLSAIRHLLPPHVSSLHKPIDANSITHSARDI
jgi:hypothetical protein